MVVSHTLAITILYDILLAKHMPCALHHHVVTPALGHHVVCPVCSATMCGKLSLVQRYIVFGIDNGLPHPHPHCVTKGYQTADAQLGIQWPGALGSPAVAATDLSLVWRNSIVCLKPAGGPSAPDPYVTLSLIAMLTLIGPELLT